MIIGGYSLHLYCDNPECPHNGPGSTYMGDFGDYNERQAKRAAMAAGWTFKLDRKTYKRLCYCPDCSK